MAHNQHQYSLSWKLINEISGRRASQRGQIAGKDENERLNNWYKHFSNLLGKAPDTTDNQEEVDKVLFDLNIPDGPFTLDEYIIAKKSIVEGKAHGDDGIASEVVKRCDLDYVILQFCNRALIERDVPDQWSSLNIIPIPKSGDLSDTNNYRGISLSSIVSKTFNKMILNRIKKSRR